MQLSFVTTLGLGSDGCQHYQITILFSQRDGKILSDHRQDGNDEVGPSAISEIKEKKKSVGITTCAKGSLVLNFLTPDWVIISYYTNYRLTKQETKGFVF